MKIVEDSYQNDFSAQKVTPTECKLLILLINLGQNITKFRSKYNESANE